MGISVSSFCAEIILNFTVDLFVCAVFLVILCAISVVQLIIINSYARTIRIKKITKFDLFNLLDGYILKAKASKEWKNIFVDKLGYKTAIIIMKFVHIFKYIIIIFNMCNCFCYYMCTLFLVIPFLENSVSLKEQRTLYKMKNL